MISRKGLKKGRFLKDCSWKLWPNHKTNLVFCSTSTKKPFPFYPLFGKVLLQLTCFKFQVVGRGGYIQVLSVNGRHESAIAPLEICNAYFDLQFFVKRQREARIILFSSTIFLVQSLFYMGFISNQTQIAKSSIFEFTLISLDSLFPFRPVNMMINSHIILCFLDLYKD